MCSSMPPSEQLWGVLVCWRPLLGCFLRCGCWSHAPGSCLASHCNLSHLSHCLAGLPTYALSSQALLPLGNLAGASGVGASC